MRAIEPRRDFLAPHLSDAVGGVAGEERDGGASRGGGGRKPCTMRRGELRRAVAPLLHPVALARDLIDYRLRLLLDVAIQHDDDALIR